MQWVGWYRGGMPVQGPPDGGWRPCMAEGRTPLGTSARAVTDWIPFSQ